MSQKVYAQLMTIYHPLEIHVTEFPSKKLWVEFFRKHKYECYPLYIKLIDPDYNEEGVPCTYEYIGQHMDMLKGIVYGEPHDVTPLMKNQLKVIYDGLKDDGIAYLDLPLCLGAFTILKRLGFAIISAKTGLTYVIDKDRI